MAVLIYSIVSKLIYAYYLVLVVYALMSWFPGARQSSFGRLLSNLSEPFLEPLRRLGLSFAGLDFSVVLAIFILNMLQKMLFIIFF
ncbi:YggT family protein [Streptococcus caprae]|uniref:YggT family protein n=1 Tax=Streptococcus caprae TaxID=1640501 RepID=A0ABV8CUS1_9STRE